MEMPGKICQVRPPMMGNIHRLMAVAGWFPMVTGWLQVVAGWLQVVAGRFPMVAGRFQVPENRLMVPQTEKNHPQATPDDHQTPKIHQLAFPNNQRYTRHQVMAGRRSRRVRYFFLRPRWLSKARADVRSPGCRSLVILISYNSSPSPCFCTFVAENSSANARFPSLTISFRNVMTTKQVKNSKISERKVMLIKGRFMVGLALLLASYPLTHAQLALILRPPPMRRRMIRLTRGRWSWSIPRRSGARLAAGASTR